MHIASSQAARSSQLARELTASHRPPKVSAVAYTLLRGVAFAEPEMQMALALMHGLSVTMCALTSVSASSRRVDGRSYCVCVSLQRSRRRRAAVSHLSPKEQG